MYEDSGYARKRTASDLLGRGEAPERDLPLASASRICTGVSIVLAEGVECLSKPGHRRTAHERLAAIQPCRRPGSRQGC
jgi:hypothetical protein